MNLALVCPDLSGHLNPMLTLGRALAARGHQVGIVSYPRVRGQIERAGLGFLPIGLPEHESGDRERDLATLASLTGFAGLKFTGAVLAKDTRIVLRDLPAVLKSHGVTGVVCDQVVPASGTAAEMLGLPSVVVCNALAMQQEPAVPPPPLPWSHRPGWMGRLRNRAGNLLLRVAGRPIYAELGRVRKANGLPPLGMVRSRGEGLAQVAQQPAFFDFPRERLPDHFHYTGPWHATGRDHAIDFPWDRLDGRPLVYASLGTLQNRLQHVFAAILAGCANLPVQVVLSLGRAGAVWDGGPIPDNAVVVPFAPQLDLLDRAAVVITHAGLNTVLETLARGKPMLCIPVTNDQPGVASRVKYLQVGDLVVPGKVTAEGVRQTVQHLLTDPAIQARSTELARRIKEGPGVNDAARIIETALQSGQRLLR